MQHLIESYSYKDADRISKFLLNYRDTADYRYLFASKEWILSFLEAYKPKLNFLIHSKNSRNYFSLSKLNSKLEFTGDPFNDFNGVFLGASGDRYDFGEVIESFSGLGYTIKWANLFELQLLQKLSRGGNLREGITGMRIPSSEETQGYDGLVSRRVRRMYDKFSGDFTFFRMFGADIKSNKAVLEELLLTRQRKLLEKRNEEYNSSFEGKFNEFITNLMNFNSLQENVFIDYCVRKGVGEIVASSLNFTKDMSTICYLRAHVPSKNNVSYGLILDYWSNNKNFYDGVKIIDLTRGNEPYKYRLGAIEYKLYDFVVAGAGILL